MTSVPNMETTAEPGDGFSQQIEAAADQRLPASRQCSSCDASSARCWCQDCNEALCDDCVSAHRRVTVTRSHRILNQPTAGGVSTPPTKFCRLHPSEPLRLFCFTCKQLTCRDCQLMTHMNHRYQFVNEALDFLKKQVELRAQPIRAQRAQVRQSLQDMETRLQDIAESESQLKKELQQSHKLITRHLENRMEHILKDVKTVLESERERIRRRMTKLKQLQQHHQSVTETAEKAKDSSDLSALLTYTAQVESQLKDLPQDTSPPQMMSDMKVITGRKSLQALLTFGQLHVSWVPFSVSNQSRDTPAAAAVASSPATPTSPVPDNQMRPPSSSSFSSVTPPTSTCLPPSCKPLPHTGNPCDSPVPVSCLSSSNQSSVSRSSSLMKTSTQIVTRPSSSTVTTLSHLSLNSGQVLLPQNVVQPVVPSVRFGFLSLAAAPSPPCTVLQLVQPSTAPIQQQPAVLLPTNSQTVYKVSNVSNVSNVPQFPMMLSQTAAYTVSPNIWPEQQRHRTGSLSNLLCLPPSSSSTSSSSSSSSSTTTCKPLPQTNTSSDTGSPDPHNRLASSWTSSSSNQLCPPPSSPVTPPTSTCLSSSCKPLPHTCDSPVPVSCPSSSSQLSVNRSGSPVKTSTQTVTHSSSSTLETSSHLVVNSGQVLLPTNQVQPVSTSAAATGNQISIGPGGSALPNHEQTLTQERLEEESDRASTGGAPSSLKCSLSDLTPPPLSLKPQQQQSPVVRAVADSACDRSVQQVAARQQEPAENEPTSTVSEESEPAGEPSDRDAEEPSSVIGHIDCGLSQWQPRVSLFRLPVSLPLPGCPLPSFRLVPGATEDEIYLEEISEDTQSHIDDIIDDFTEPLSSPESPVTLQIVSCSACGSAYASVICSACGRGFHRDCHVPPVGPDIWLEWTCSLCQDLSDPADPFSSDRPQRPPSPCLSLQDQRRCETLLLHLKVEGCGRLSEVGSVWSRVKSISERLTLRRSPSYQTAAQFVSDIWSLFKHTQDDDVLNKLQESFQRRLMETFSSELHPPVLTPPSRETEEGSKVTDSEGGSKVTNSEGGSKVTSEGQNAITSELKLMETRKRLKEFLGNSGSKRRKVDQSSPSTFVAPASRFCPFLGENKF